MALVTLYALIGDDIRLWLTDKPADPYFYAFFIVSLFLFSLELLINSLVVDGFKYSFFFWLDIIATLSLIPDIPWITDPISLLLSMTPNTQSADVSLGTTISATSTNDRAQRLVKSIRLIRLIRIIKLYKYAVKSNTEEEETKLREQQKLSQTTQQAALKREMEPSRLGKVLSDTLIREVIIGILIMLMILPNITYSGQDLSTSYGLEKIFWYGTSSCLKLNGDFYCSRDNWMTTDGWDQLLYDFVMSTRLSESVTINKQLLWLYVPDFRNGGVMKSITSISVNGTVVWNQNENCSGFTISNKDCEF